MALLMAHSEHSEHFRTSSAPFKFFQMAWSFKRAAWGFKVISPPSQFCFTVWSLTNSQEISYNQNMELETKLLVVPQRKEMQMIFFTFQQSLDAFINFYRIQPLVKKFHGTKFNSEFWLLEFLLLGDFVHLPNATFCLLASNHAKQLLPMIFPKKEQRPFYPQIALITYQHCFRMFFSKGFH